MFNFSDYYGIIMIGLVMLIVFILYCTVGFKSDARAKKAMRRVKMQKAAEMNFNTVEEYEAYIEAQEAKTTEKKQKRKTKKTAANGGKHQHTAGHDDQTVLSVEKGGKGGETQVTPVFSGSMNDIAKEINMEDIQHLIAEQQNNHISVDIDDDGNMDSVHIPNEAIGEQIRQVAMDAVAQSGGQKTDDLTETVVIPKAKMAEELNKQDDEAEGKAQSAAVKTEAKVEPQPEPQNSIVDESAVDTGNGGKLDLEQIKEMLKNARCGEEKVSAPADDSDVVVPPATPYVQSIPRILNTKEAIAVPSEAPKVTTFYPDGKVMRDNKPVTKRSFYRNEYDAQSKAEEQPQAESKAADNDTVITEDKVLTAETAKQADAEIKAETKEETSDKTAKAEIQETAAKDTAPAPQAEVKSEAAAPQAEIEENKENKKANEIGGSIEVAAETASDTENSQAAQAEPAKAAEPQEAIKEEVKEEVKKEIKNEEINKEEINKKIKNEAVTEEANEAQSAVAENTAENDQQSTAKETEPQNSDVQPQTTAAAEAEDNENEVVAEQNAENTTETAEQNGGESTETIKTAEPKKGGAFSRMKEKFGKKASKAAKTAVETGAAAAVTAAAGAAAEKAAGAAVLSGVQGEDDTQSQKPQTANREKNDEQAENNRRSDILMPEKPKAFGRRMAWLAVPNMGSAEVLKALNLKDIAPANWTNGLAKAYEKNDALFVTPNLGGWTLVIGHALWQKIDVSQPVERSVWLQKLADSFREVFYFSSDDDTKNHGWFYIRDGLLVRAYGYSGELDEVMWNFGQESQEEHKLIQGFAMGKTKVVPTEKDVLTLAAAWSVDPTFSHDNSRPDIGFMGRL